MKYIYLLISLFLFAGCAGDYVQTKELENQLFACDNAQAEGCDVMRDELQRRYDKKIKKAKRDAKCTTGARCFYTKDAYGFIEIR